jgi:hypothetical protein
MKSWVLMLFVAAVPLSLAGQTSAKKPQLPPHPNGPANEEIQTEKIVVPGQAPAVPSLQVVVPGRMEPEQVKALAHRIWLAQYRLNDLLAQVNPGKWKMAPGLRQSFDQSMDSLHKALEAEEGWRSQLEARPDSIYLGFMTYVAISAVLPRVDGVAHSVSRYENGSFGAQYSQAGNQLFDLQQMIEPHLAALLKNQDNVFLVVQSNLASCQNELSFAEHNKEGSATPMRNIAPAFKGHGRPAHSTTTAGSAKPAPVKAAPAGKSSSNPPKKTQTE